jgi:asparagine synthase (glutamine-hydrolysing)
MCGIFGFNWDSKELLSRMNNVLLHRGPDDFASYSDTNISLGMRRLAIMDLKKDLYPIKNEEGNLLVVFNGELYNYQEIKADLENKGHRFITECDAEIIPHAFEEYGESFITKVNGMFAIAMYDTKTKRLFLFRDRLGEKPLYYFYDVKTNKFAFASEIKCLLEMDNFKREINTDALNNYFTYRYTPGEETLFKGIYRVSPGHLLIHDTGLKSHRYWDYKFKPNNNSLKENAKFVRYLLDDSVRMRLMSDVPLGAYLSGGLDSSAIVAIMSKYSDNVNTFNVSFNGTEFDESKYAELVADKFNTNHTQIDIELDAIKVLPDVLWHLDEPIADAATIPVFLMSKETKKVATVVLTGEGSDEIFGGYERFRHLNFAYKFRNLPQGLRNIPSRIYEKSKNKNLVRGSNLLMNLQNKKQAYLSYYSVFDDDEKKEFYNPGLKKENSKFNLNQYFQNSFYDGIMDVDIRERLPNNMLLKTDKMTMAHSIESRVPFLDHRLVEFSAKIPFNQKVSLFQDKIVYREAIKGLVPSEIVNRKKQGFTIPTDKWAKEGLSDYLVNLVKENKEPYLNHDYIQKIIDNVGNSFYYKRQYWAVLMYEQWYERFIGGQEN